MLDEAGGREYQQQGRRGTDCIIKSSFNTVYKQVISVLVLLTHQLE